MAIIGRSSLRSEFLKKILRNLAGSFFIRLNFPLGRRGDGFLSREIRYIEGRLPYFFSLSGQNFRKKEISIHLMNSPAKTEQSVMI